jgi:hypothetical protein
MKSPKSVSEKTVYTDFLTNYCVLVRKDNDVFYLFLQKQKIGAKLNIYLEEGTYHKRLFRGPSTNDLKK